MQPYTWPLLFDEDSCLLFDRRVVFVFATLSTTYIKMHRKKRFVISVAAFLRHYINEYQSPI